MGEWDRLSLESLFLERADSHQRRELEVESQEKNYLKDHLNLDDFKRENEPLTLYTSQNNRELFLKMIPDLPSDSVECLDQDRRSFKLKLFQEGIPKQTPYIFLKFVAYVHPPSYTIIGEKIHLVDTSSPENILEAALAFSRWPFLKTELTHFKNWEREEIDQIPYYRKRNLFNRIMLGRRPSLGFLFLDHTGLLEKLLPELTAGKNLQQNRFHAYDIFEHSLRALDGAFKADIVLRWSALLHDIGKVATRKLKENGEASFYNHELHSARMVVPIMKRIGIPKEVGMRVRFLVKNHMFHYTHEWTDKAVKRFIKKIDARDLQDLIELRLADRKGSGKKTKFPKGLQMLMEHIDEVKAQENEFKITDLDISGYDLMDLGLTPGPVIGETLKILWSYVKEKKLLNEKELLLEEARNVLSCKTI